MTQVPLSCPSVESERLTVSKGAEKHRHVIPRSRLLLRGGFDHTAVLKDVITLERTRLSVTKG